jgi:hypothetical protein
MIEVWRRNNTVCSEDPVHIHRRDGDVEGFRRLLENLRVLLKCLFLA